MATFSATKDPTEVLDYGIDYTALFNEVTPADSISLSAWAVSPTGELLIDSSGTNGNIAEVWLSGGVLNRKYDVTNTVTTTNGRVFERTIKVTMKNK